MLYGNYLAVVIAMYRSNLHDYLQGDYFTAFAKPQAVRNDGSCFDHERVEKPWGNCIQIDKTTADRYNVTVVTLYFSHELDITMHKWLLLTYKIPPEPSARRVYIWRKLKRIGALLHQEAGWIVPSNARTQEQFQWLSAEIIEMGGEATLWRAEIILGTSEETLIQKFIEQVDQPYLEIIEKLEQGEADLESLSRQYQQILSKDYFKSETGRRLREAFLSMRGDES